MDKRNGEIARRELGEVAKIKCQGSGVEGVEVSFGLGEVFGGIEIGEPETLGG